MADSTAHAALARADRDCVAVIDSLSDRAREAHAVSCTRGDPEDTRERAGLVAALRTAGIMAASIMRRSNGWDARPPMVPRRPLPGDPTRPHRATSFSAASDHPLGTSAMGATRET